MHWFLKFILGKALYMFRTVPLSIIRGLSLYTQQRHMSYRFADSLRAGSGWNPDPARWLSVNVYDIYHCCPKHVEFLSKNKFEKSVHLIGFIIRIHHDARSHESKILWVLSNSSDVVNCTFLQTVSYIFPNQFYVNGYNFEISNWIYHNRNFRVSWHLRYS